ncbi:CBS domain containing-hemolysin-like protein [Mycoplasmopsis mustelae]|uniref:CBS domain containing-hemolysin-like protein n=1 Tax=Mycoplasmopsis mustelae TaxID=171289 RepID=A0A4R7UEX3_9BACT|nr:CNNM domain-containing protein [Mycoplasmopsis mustelae]TDV24443.1 CBS domain containing-hemolysin-like protein [Mycoplasmopsis mustelae]
MNWYSFIVLPFLLLLFVLSAVYSGCEIAYSTISKAKIYEMLERKEKCAKLINKYAGRYERVLTTILIGNNLVNVISSILTSWFLAQLIPNNESLTIIITTVIVTPLLVIFGEITPKLIAKKYPKKYLQIFIWWIEFSYWIFWILTWPIKRFSKQMYITNSEQDLKSMINLAQSEGVLQTGESILAKNALDLDSTKVASHYVKLKDVTTLNYKASLQEAKDLFKETNYSRIPVEKNGELIGIILLKDIFYLTRARIINYVKTVPFISTHSVLSSALDKMRAARAQMAFVVENNNSTDILGIISFEDIMEEIVGEIYDEYDDDEDIFEISLEKSRVKGNVIMWDLFKQMKINTNLLKEDEENLTVYQYFTKKIDRPRLYKNSKYTLKNKVTFKVLELYKDNKSKHSKDKACIEVSIE